MIGWYAFLVLNLSLHIFDGVRRLTLEFNGLSGERSDAEMTREPLSVIRGLHELHRSASAACNCLRSPRCTDARMKVCEDRVNVQRYNSIRRHL